MGYKLIRFNSMKGKLKRINGIWGSVKKFPDFFLPSKLWWTMISYRLDRMSLTISACKFGRSCAMVFRESGTSSGKDNDKAPSQISQIVQQFPAETNIPHHTATALSGSRSEWILSVPNSESGSRFITNVDISSNATVEIWKIPQEDFRPCFQQWQNRMNKCVRAQVFYSEGDYVSVVVCAVITINTSIPGTFWLLFYTGRIPKRRKKLTAHESDKFR
jgi:hypothetical protein